MKGFREAVRAHDEALARAGVVCWIGAEPTFTRADSQEPWPGVVRDVSAGGLGVVLARRFEPGTVLTVELEGGLRKQTRLLLAKVVRVQSEGLGHWKHGCQFVAPSEDDPLVTLVPSADA